MGWKEITQHQSCKGALLPADCRGVHGCRSVHGCRGVHGCRSVHGCRGVHGCRSVHGCRGVHVFCFMRAELQGTHARLHQTDLTGT
ncbi:hypothetical protein EYF80_063478 [Liparis tanakae]|uniref:Uncharacterized protein n=1 Tax=Liparis tanakae TaxID=230148 RepID=A0A4Z2EC17_9TELE|nr:hypothetical protein EYF80_063478 [Liparis tanakae]